MVLRGLGDQAVVAGEVTLQRTVQVQLLGIGIDEFVNASRDADRTKIPAGSDGDAGEVFRDCAEASRLLYFPKTVKRS